MKIVESTDHFLQTVYRLEEDDRFHMIATFYNKHDAEVAKAAIEEDRKEREKKNNSWWYS
jgi:hypothetical protein